MNFYFLFIYSLQSSIERSMDSIVREEVSVLQVHNIIYLLLMFCVYTLLF